MLCPIRKKPLIIAGLILSLSLVVLVVSVFFFKFRGWGTKNCPPKDLLNHIPIVSPDKEKVFYLSSDKKQLCFVNTKKKIAVNLFSENNNLTLYAPKWSPDNSMAVFYENYSSVFEDQSSSGVQNIYLVEAETGRMKILLSGDQLGLKPRQIPVLFVPGWSPYGDYIEAMVGWEGPSNIFLVKPDGSDLRKIGWGSEITWENGETMIIKSFPYGDCSAQYQAEERCQAKEYRYNIRTGEK